MGLFGPKREERQGLLADLDRGYTNGGHLQLDDEVWDMSTAEGWQAYQKACEQAGEMVDEVIEEEKHFKFFGIW